MERPYRFQALLAECASVFGRTRPAFLAWELDSTDEKLLWGTLEKLERSAKNFEKTKGEYVLLIQGAPLSKPKKNFS
jgi:16S rRNA C1402 (ribose-2'-O) methylase RsmI